MKIRYHTVGSLVFNHVEAEDLVQHCVFPVFLAVPSQIYPSVQPGIETISSDQKLQQVDVDQIRLQPSQQIQEREDDWFVLFDSIREEAETPATGIHLLYLCTS